MKKVILAGFLITSWLTTHGQEVQIGTLKGQSGYVDTNGAKIYYERYGEGTPLLILHGNSGSVKGRHRIITDLAKTFSVVAMDSRCHGKSSCPEADLTYEKMMQDVHMVLEKLDIKDVMIWGHSDGGILGLMLGYSYPERINRMLISGANLIKSALEPELVAFIDRYDEIPDPTLKKQVKLMATQSEIDIEDVEKIDIPVTLLVGDRDAMPLEHTIEIFHALPKANLAVFPATTHFMENRQGDIVDLLNEMLEPFKAPSTVEVANYMAGQLFGDK